MAPLTSVFLDTTILLGGLIDFGASGRASQGILDRVADGRISDVRTSWHCCLEFYAVSTRLPPGFRLTPQQAVRLLSDLLSMVAVEQLRKDAIARFLEMAVSERVVGGRIYDAHIAEVARLAGADVIVTENRRHFTSLLKHGVRVLRPSEFLDELE